MKHTTDTATDIAVHSTAEDAESAGAAASAPRTPRLQKKSRRYVIALLLGCDINEVEAYQPSRCPNVFTDGSDYFCAVKANEKPPSAFDGWQPFGGPSSAAEWITRETGYTVMRTIAENEANEVRS